MKNAMYEEYDLSFAWDEQSQNMVDEFKNCFVIKEQLIMKKILKFLGASSVQVQFSL